MRLRNYDLRPRFVRPPAKVHTDTDQSGRKIDVLLLEDAGVRSSTGEVAHTIIARGCIVAQMPPQSPSPKDMRALRVMGRNWTASLFGPALLQHFAKRFWMLGDPAQIREIARRGGLLADAQAGEYEATPPIVSGKPPEVPVDPQEAAFIAGDTPELEALDRLEHEPDSAPSGVSPAEVRRLIRRARLSRQQQRVWTLLRRGRSNGQIARRLGVSEARVRELRMEIKNKFRTLARDDAS